MSHGFRKEKDVLGEVDVPAEVYWGINTFRAVQNFQISNKRFPAVFLLALAEIKKACLLANQKLGLIDTVNSDALLAAMDELLEEGRFLDQFPVDVYQSGSGTQTNMNMNEVLANRANEILGFRRGKKHPVHPNDHVNKGQSSNDVIPTAMHVSALHLVKDKLLPSLEKLNHALSEKIKEFEGIVKVARTHLQDAVPIPLSMEFQVYNQQVESSIARVKRVMDQLMVIPLGGTAVGTGINAPEGFGRLANEMLSEITGFTLRLNPNPAEGISSHNAIVAMSSATRLLALSLMKMANDIRWMGSGPSAGLLDLLLPANEPGSSIMPGKINPTQSEALIQVCLQIIGNDTVISLAESHGSLLDLNLCKPVMIYNLLDSMEIISNAVNSFVDNCLKELKANTEQIKTHLERMLMTVTNLIPYLGYDKCAEIAQKAFRENKTIREVIKEMNITIEADIDALLDPKKMV